MTRNDITPIAPPGIGEVLADPSAWHTWALEMPAPAPAASIRRPGRIRRWMAAAAAVVARVALVAAGAAPNTPATAQTAQDSLTPRGLASGGVR